MIGDQIWFIAKEVAATLEYASTQKALQCVKDKYKRMLNFEECKEIFSSNQFGYSKINSIRPPDNTGYLFTIFNVEEAMNVV